MDLTRFDRIAKRFAQRRLSRRAALRQGGTGLAAGALAAAGLGRAADVHAQDAALAAGPGAAAAHPVVGTWRWADDLQNLADASYAVFHADGTYVEMSPGHGVGIGTWEATGARSATLTVVFQDIDPSLAAFAPGLLTYRLDVRVDETSNAQTATSPLYVQTPDGVIVEERALDGTATRVEVAATGPIRALATSAQATPPVASPAAGAAGDDLLGRYVVVRLRTLTGNRPVPEVQDLIQTGYVPLVRAIPGFVAYLGMADPDSRQSVYVVVFDDKAGADESTVVAQAWLADNGYDFFAGEPIVIEGPISVAAGSFAGGSAAMAIAAGFGKVVPTVIAGDPTVAQGLIGPAAVSGEPVADCPPSPRAPDRWWHGGGGKQSGSSLPDVRWK